MKNIRSMESVKCDSCIHTAVCIYKSLLPKTVQEIIGTDDLTKLGEEINNEAPFKLSMECIHRSGPMTVSIREPQTPKAPQSYREAYNSKPNEVPNIQETPEVPKFVERRL